MRKTQAQPGGIRGRSLTGYLVGLCTTVALIVAGIFTVLLLSLGNLRSDDTRARRAGDLVIQSSTVERSVVDLETGLRGLLITRDPLYLAPYNQALARLPAEFATLRRVAMTRAQQQQVDQISSSVNAYVQHYATPLAATHGALSHAQEMRATARGKGLVDALRAEFNALTAGELALRQRQRAHADQRADTAAVVAAAGLGISLVLVLGLGFYLVWRFVEPARTVAQAADRLASGKLGARVPEVGIGEVAWLGRSFNRMSEALQARDEAVSSAREQLRQALTEARETSEMKSNFLANMSHEIRTPLNGVVGMMELLSETPLGAEQQEYVDVARASAEALMSVVNDVLDIAKIEAGGIELEQREFDVHHVVESACDMVAATARGKGIELQSFVHDDVPRFVRGDRVRLGQILNNLVSNAVKFTAEGEVVVEASLEERSELAVTLRFDVRDTGIGIPPSQIERLFERFTQAESGTTRTYGGTGLGLTIVRELTRMMGGDVQVASQPEQGSTFSCTVPFTSAEVPAAPAAPQHVLRGLHVLVVDDNATNRRIFEAYVVSWGMRVEVAASAKEGVAKLRRAFASGDPYDLALLDLNMPGNSGIELARQVRASTQLAHTHLILLTSTPHSRLDELAHQVGIGCVLSKPVRQSRLLDAIGELLADKPADTAPASPQPQADAALAGGPIRRRVLVAEDQPVNWMLVERLLAHRGFEAQHAGDGEEALRMLESDEYDLVLMDCQMPVLDGYEATRRLRQREAGSDRHLTVVAMTANALRGDRERCLAVGMDGYLAKPITGQALDMVLQQSLAERPQSPAPVPAAGATRAVAPERLSEMRTLFSDAELSQMFTQLRLDVEEQFRRLDRALSGTDQRQVAHAAHRILGSARMIGANALGQAAAALQHAAERGEGDLAQRAGVLRERWQAVDAMLADVDLRGAA